MSILLQISECSTQIRAVREQATQLKLIRDDLIKRAYYQENISQPKIAAAADIGQEQVSKLVRKQALKAAGKWQYGT